MPDEKKNEKQDSLPERVTFWVSMLLVASLFGFLGVRVVHDEGSRNQLPCVIAVAEPDRAEQMDTAHWLIPVSVRNTSELAVKEVMLRATYRTKSGEQDADVSFAYLAGGTSGDAFVVTDLPPQEAKMRVFVLTLQTQRKARGY